MHDIAPVVSLAFHHKGLRPNCFFDWAEQYISIEHAIGHGMLEPAVIDHRYAIAGAVNRSIQCSPLSAFPAHGETAAFTM